MNIQRSVKGIEWEPDTAEREYNKSLSTQVPARTVIRLKSRYGKQKLQRKVSILDKDMPGHINKTTGILGVDASTIAKDSLD